MTGETPASGLFPVEATEALVDQLNQVFFSGHKSEIIGEKIAGQPALLWPDRWPELEAIAEAQEGAVKDALLFSITVIEDAHRQLVATGGGWFVGEGPLGELKEQVTSHLLSDEEALQRAADPEMQWRMSPYYVEYCAGRAASIAQSSNWQDGVLLARLTLAAAATYPVDHVRPQMRRSAIIGWLQVATAACNAVPDGALFNEAKAAGLELLEEQSAGDAKASAETLFELGVLHLDTYHGGRDFMNLKADLDSWRQRFLDHYGLAAFKDDRQMPEAIDAFNEASSLLAEAAALQDGIARGRSLKARADALALIELMGGDADRGALRECVEEALRLVPEDQFPAQVATLRQLNRHFELGIVTGELVPRKEAVAEIEEQEAATYFQKHGYIRAYERIQAAAMGLAGPEPDRAISIFVRCWPELRERERSNAGRKVLSILAAKADAKGLLGRHGGDFAKAASAIEAEAFELRLPLTVGVALNGADQDREAEVLFLAERAIALNADGPPELTEMLRLLNASLLIGAAVNGANSGNWKGTTAYYCDALALLINLGFYDLVSDILPRAADAALHEGDQGITRMTVTLASLTPLMSRANQPRLGDNVHETWGKLIAEGLGSGQVNPARYNVQIQGVKGATFAVMLHTGTRYDARQDPVAMDYLRRRSEIGEHEGISDAMLSEHVLISHHARVAAEGPAGAVERLSQKFDAHVVAQLTQGEDALEAYLLQPEWSQRLDDTDVLVDLYLGPADEGQAAFVTGISTKAGRKLSVGRSGFPLKYLQLEVQGRELEASPFGLFAAHLREALQDHPGPAQATDDALKELRSVADFLRGAMPFLREERAKGRTHLSFVPHGPFHFCPLHLMPDEDDILADDWTVTYLPHPAMLRRRQRVNLPGNSSTAAFGLSFAKGEHGCDPLPGAADEATRVAALMGGELYLEGEATEEQLLQSLATSRFVHVATHGRQNIFAPMLQQLFLAPGARSDGIFHAYEALGLDLGQLDLVTLSACETALGRFDVNDNLRGLVAVLLIAGAATVISTLWPVRDAVSKHFFESLYGHLAFGKDKLAAYRKAQLDTRAVYPAFRDWGAFTYTGAW